MSFQQAFLSTLEHPLVPVRYSQGSKRRAAQLQQFLSPLQSSAKQYLRSEDSLELVVVNHKDWRRLFNYPYGLPFTRNHPKAKHSAKVSIVVAADYSPRFVHRFDALLLRAGQAGVKAPGDVREFLDLLVGHEWGHASANVSGLRSRVRWFDEFLATLIFLLALQETGQEGMCQRFLAWAEISKQGSQVEGLGLAEMSSRLSFTEMLWFQSVLTQRAAEVVPLGWDFIVQLKAAMETAGKDQLSEVLVALEPGFEGWLEQFAGADSL
jgi:hypothetical protein